MRACLTAMGWMLGRRSGRITGRMLGLSLMSLLSIVGLVGCSETDRNSPGMGEETADYVVKVNGYDVSKTCPVLYEGGIVYLSAEEILEQFGVVAVEQPGQSTNGQAPGAPYTLLAVTEDHTIQHVAETSEVLIDGESVAMSRPSIVENGAVYVPASSLEKVLTVQILPDAREISIDLAVSSTAQNLLHLNTLKRADYFCSDRLFRYASYLMHHADLDPKKAIALVNANLDKPFYSDVAMVADPGDLLVLCNKYSQLPKDYEPKDLQPMGDGYYLRAEAAEAYREMTQAAAKENLPFQLKSAFRSYATQQTLYNNSVSRLGQAEGEKVSARPGFSEHQTGLALDVTQPTGDYGLSSASFEKTSQYAWICQHAHEYGFIQRYPQEKTDITGFIFEPWHYRYVGKDVAKLIYEQGITFEEYVGLYRVNL